MPVVLTMGEPKGICAEITIKAWQSLKETNSVFYLHCLPGFIKGGIQIQHPSEAAQAFKNGVPFISLSKDRAVIRSIEKSVEDIRKGEAAALVTNPVQKEFLYEDGFNFPGHTEFLGHLTHTTPVMMLACDDLKVVPATIHVPLKDVATNLTQEKIITTASIVLNALKERFQIPSPRLAVAGLNPHAGENGHIGKEEQDIIVPAMRVLQQQGYHITGCYPADTLFHTEARKTYDAALCMYHDQALIPIKTLDFWGGVNITLGLPFLRTSPITAPA